MSIERPESEGESRAVRVMKIVAALDAVAARVGVTDWADIAEWAKSLSWDEFVALATTVGGLSSRPSVTTRAETHVWLAMRCAIGHRADAAAARRDDWATGNVVPFRGRSDR